MTMVRICNRAANLLLTLAVLALLVFAIGPHTGAYRTISILSGSMAPEFNEGDAIISTPMSVREVRAGHVISYRPPIAGKPLVTHRVTKLVHGGSRPEVRTKGDANRSADPWTARLDAGVVWRQRAVIPHAGTVIRALRSPVLRPIVIYVVPALAMLVILIGIWTSGPRPEEDGAYEEWWAWEEWGRVT